MKESSSTREDTQELLKILMTFQLVYTEKFDTIAEARVREKQLKSYKSKKYIEWLISRAASSTGRASGS